MLQTEFTQLYERLQRYAFKGAGRYFKDPSLRQDAADNAMNDAVDEWIKLGTYDEEVAKRVIQSSLRKSSRNRNIEPIDLPDTEEYQGFHGYRVKG